MAGASSFSRQSSPVAAGEWHFLVGVMESATSRRLYVDGVAVTQDTGSVVFNANIDTITVGHTGDTTPNRRYDGRLAGGALGPFLVQTELTPAQIADLYALGAAALGL